VKNFSGGWSGRGQTGTPDQTDHSAASDKGDHFHCIYEIGPYPILLA
jgi:hypothetical protein